MLGYRATRPEFCRCIMNSLDIMLYIVGATALFLLFTAGYALGHKDGKREGYTLGRSIARNLVEVSK